MQAASGKGSEGEGGRVATVTGKAAVVTATAGVEKATVVVEKATMVEARVQVVVARVMGETARLAMARVAAARAWAVAVKAEAPGNLSCSYPLPPRRKLCRRLRRLRCCGQVQHPHSGMGCTVLSYRTPR